MQSLWWLPELRGDFFYIPLPFCVESYEAEWSEVGVTIKVICFGCYNPRDKLRSCGLLMCDVLVVIARNTTGLRVFVCQGVGGDVCSGQWHQYCVCHDVENTFRFKVASAKASRLICLGLHWAIVSSLHNIQLLASLVHVDFFIENKAHTYQ